MYPAGKSIRSIAAVMRLRLPDDLVRHLSSTNLIENLIGSVCKLSAWVQNRRDGQMALRWTCATAMDAAKRFRRLKGYRGLPTRITALRDLAPSMQTRDEKTLSEELPIAS